MEALLFRVHVLHDLVQIFWCVDGYLRISIGTIEGLRVTHLNVGPLECKRRENLGEVIMPNFTRGDMAADGLMLEG